MLLHEYLRRSSRERPDKVALVAGPSRITYAQLARDADTLAGALARGGLHRGDRVALYLENTPETVLGIFGALAAGGVFVVVNPATQPDRLGFVLENCGARILITSREKLPAARQALTLCSTPPALVLTGTGDAPAGASPVPVSTSAGGVLHNVSACRAAGSFSREVMRMRAPQFSRTKPSRSGCVAGFTTTNTPPAARAPKIPSTVSGVFSR